MNTHQTFTGYFCPDIKDIARIHILHPQTHGKTYGDVSSLLKFDAYLHELVLPFLSPVNVFRSDSVRVLRRGFINTYAASV